MKKRNYWLGLTMIKGLGSIRISNLIKYFGNPEIIWKASAKQLRRVKGIGVLADKIVNQRNKIDLSKVINVLKRKEINFVTLTESGYPDLLKEIYDPPPVLFYKGQLSFAQPAVALVGSRKATNYGRQTAKILAEELVQKGITVVSGMARGIDTFSHLGALQGKGKTIAVLGSGIDYIYPPDNKKLYHEIINEGLILSEFPPGVKPLAANFPRRNRIISGLSQGTVVIEAAQKSGSLITANLALEQGKEVFAVPGNINRRQSRGTNNLIKEGAKIVTCVQDILEELFLFPTQSQKTSEKQIYPELSTKEMQVVNILQNEGELHINQIINKSRLEVSEVNSILLQLELKGIVSRGEAKKYNFKGLQNLLKPI